MRKKKNNQRGFTLVEVVVGLLILSIVTVSMLTAFTQSARTNIKSEDLQGAEELCANLVEFVGAGGEDFSVIGGTAGAASGDENAIQTFTLSNVRMGYGTYTVEVTKDNNPEKYKDTLNQYDVITLGDPLRASVLVDVSKSGVAEVDESALNYFYSLNLDAIDAKNYDALLQAQEDGEEDPVLYSTSFSQDALKGELSRDLVFRVKRVSESGQEKMQLEASLLYTIHAFKEIAIPDGTECTKEYVIFRSEKFLCSPGATDPKLASIYVAYDKSDYAQYGTVQGIRFIEEDGSGNNQLLEADLYVALQDSATVAAAAAQDALTDRMKTDSVEVSFENKSGTVAGPKKCTIYCTGSASTKAAYSNVTVNSKKGIIATDTKVRVVAYEFKVLKAGTTAVLASDKAVVVQR